jgi:hypothetical protein
VLVHLRVDVAVDHEEVEPAVVVVVEKAVAPADKGNGGLGDSGLVADVGKARVAVVVVEHLIVVAKVGDEKIEQAVVLVVARGNAHGGDLAAVLVQREARRVALVVEGAVALVDVEKVGLGVVAHQQVGLAVAVERGKDGGEAVVVFLVFDAGLHGRVGKRVRRRCCGRGGRARPSGLSGRS